jgi:hypothetical protein
MSLAGLDWSVIKNQNYARNPQGHVVPVSSYSIFRDTDGAELVSNVGEGFTVKQNRECFQFVDDLLQDNGGAHYDSAGALGNGATIWCAVRVPRADIAVSGEDRSESYLVFTTAHDGSMAHTAALSSVRVVCRRCAFTRIGSRRGTLAKRTWSLHVVILRKDRNLVLISTGPFVYCPSQSVSRIHKGGPM